MQNKLYEKISSVNTLWRAWNRLNKKSGMQGIDGVSLKDFEKRINFNLKQISTELEKGTYTPEPGLRFYIPKTEPGEKRALCMPVIKDKIVQEAVRSVIEPIFSSNFCDFSYAYRTGKGPQKAINRVMHYLRQKHAWIAVIDIENFFGSIDHKILLQLLSQKIHEQPVIRLIELWLKMGVVEYGKWIDTVQGVSQGNVISPLLSNIYLNEFDHEMINKDFNSVRYADDIVFLEKSCDKAMAALKWTKDFLDKKLNLKLKTEATAVCESRKGFVFLGYLFRGTQRTIAPQKMIKIQNSVRTIIRRTKTLSDCVDQLNDSIAGWRNYYGLGDTNDQMAFLNDFLFNELKTILKMNCKSEKLTEKIIKEKLQRLELFLPYNFSEMENWINKIARESRLIEIEKIRIEQKTEQKTIQKSVVTQKKKYQKILAEESDLIISEPGYFIGKTSRRVVVRLKGKTVKEVPFFRLKNILVTSNGVSFSSDLIWYCSKEGIPISFCDAYGRPYAQIMSSSLPFYKLTVQQVNANNNEKGIYLAGAFAGGKINNQLNLMKYYNKYKERKKSDFSEKTSEDISAVKSLLIKLKEAAGDADYEKARSRIMGFEGQAGAVYWQFIRRLIGGDVYFTGREHRGATDMVNCLLNYGYGILYSVIHQSALLARLNPNIGFLHREQTGKPTLVYDLIEEFRQPVVDKVIISMIRKKEALEMDGTSLSRVTREKVVRHIMNKLNTAVSFRGKKVLMREIIKQQALSVAKFLNGTGIYKPYIDKW